MEGRNQPVFTKDDVHHSAVLHGIGRPTLRRTEIVDVGVTVLHKFTLREGIIRVVGRAKTSPGIFRILAAAALHSLAPAGLIAAPVASVGALVALIGTPVASIGTLVALIVAPVASVGALVARVITLIVTPGCHSCPRYCRSLGPMPRIPQ